MNSANVLFSLLPKNQAAHQIAHFDPNKHLLSFIFHPDLAQVVQALHVGHLKSKATYEAGCCIATLGRNGDIAIPCCEIVTKDSHCGFVVADSTIKFVDNSTNYTCQAYGGQGGTQRLLSNGNRVAGKELGLGKIEIQVTSSITAEFDIVWHYQSDNLLPALQAWYTARRPTAPMIAGVPDGGQVQQAQQSPQQIQQPPAHGTHTNPPEVLEPFSLSGGIFLGAGAFGTVHQVRDPNTGAVAAVKTMHPENRRAWKLVKREIEAMGRFEHPNVVQLIASRVDPHRRWAQIFMGLKKLNLDSLIRRTDRPEENYLAGLMYHDVLKGLDHIHSKGILHRDIKPANILCSLENCKWSFCIADFGLCNEFNNAVTVCGTSQFAAPEVHSGDLQTTAVDLWSLFVTIFWTVNLENFRGCDSWNTYAEFGEWLFVVAKKHWNDLDVIHELIVFDPKNRATAAQMLGKVFKGDGLTTDGEIPPLETAMLPDPTIFRYFQSQLDTRVSPPNNLLRAAPPVNRAVRRAWPERLPRNFPAPAAWAPRPMKTLVIEPRRPGLGLIRNGAGRNLLERPTTQQAILPSQPGEDQETALIERAAGDRGLVTIATRNNQVMERANESQNRPVIDNGAAACYGRKMIAEASFDRTKNMPGAFPLSLT